MNSSAWASHRCISRLYLGAILVFAVIKRAALILRVSNELGIHRANTSRLVQMGL